MQTAPNFFHEFIWMAGIVKKIITNRNLEKYLIALDRFVALEEVTYHSLSLISFLCSLLFN